MIQYWVDQNVHLGFSIDVTENSELLGQHNTNRHFIVDNIEKLGWLTGKSDSLGWETETENGMGFGTIVRGQLIIFS